MTRFSPHTRGCSDAKAEALRLEQVFPAYAGMFPVRPRRSPESACFPRIRGDVPCATSAITGISMFSPHTRGCSAEALKAQVDYAVFPAYAGMFLQYHLGGLQLQVFPAYAGMFRQPQSAGRRSLGFPRIRGDVPNHERRTVAVPRFSPHTRGCSASDIGVAVGVSGFPRIRGDVPQAALSLPPGKAVFPAYAGMFLPRVSSV